MPTTIHLRKLAGPLWLDDRLAGAGGRPDREVAPELSDRLAAFYEDAVTATFSPRKANVFRDYLAIHRDGWSEQRRRQAMCDVIARRMLHDVLTPERYLDHFMPDIERFLASREYELLRGADEVRYTAPLYIDIGIEDGIGQLRVRADIVYRHARAWRALDFETRDLSMEADPLAAVVEDSLRHELKAACYLIAIRRELGAAAAAGVTYFYSSPAIAVVQQPSPAWLDGWEAALPRISRALLGREGGVVPRWEATVPRAHAETPADLVGPSRTPPGKSPDDSPGSDHIYRVAAAEV